MYSPTTRSRLGPKPSSAAPRSPSFARSPSVSKRSDGNNGTSGNANTDTSVGGLSTSSRANASPTNVRFGNSSVSPLSAAALMNNTSPFSKATGSPAASPSRAATSPFSPNIDKSAFNNSSGGNSSSILQGGAVGLWRVARDGHSPPSQDGAANGSSRYAQRPATQGVQSSGGGGGGAGRLSFQPRGLPSSPARNGNAAPELKQHVSVSNNTSAPLLNMSLDAALMGGLLKSEGVGLSNDSASTPKVEEPQDTMVNGLNTNRASALFPKRPAASGAVGANTYRSLSANAMTGHHSHQQHTIGGGSANTNSYLIPALKLPVCRRLNQPPYPIAGPGASANNDAFGASPDSPASPSSPATIDVPPAFVTVVFDLDETLCNNRLPGKAMLRPGCMELLNALAAIRDDPSKNCFVEIILWTASMECVARPVLERMDPNNTVFNHLIFRDRRWYKEHGYTKDLRLLGRDLSHVVIIENSPMSVVLNRKHAILTKDFVGGGSVNYYYGGGPLNTRTSTGSLTDPTLFIVKKVLTDWALAVGAAAVDDIGNDNKSRSQHDPAFVPLPMPLGIVEFLREAPEISPSNEVVMSAAAGLGLTTNSNGGGLNRSSLSMSSSTMCGSPTRSLRGGGSGGGSLAARSSPWGGTARSISASSTVRRYR